MWLEKASAWVLHFTWSIHDGQEARAGWEKNIPAAGAAVQRPLRCQCPPNKENRPAWQKAHLLGSYSLKCAPCKHYPKEYPTMALLKRCILLYLYFRGQETEINLLACLWSIRWSAARSGFELSMFESRIWNFHIQLFSLSLEINPTQLSCIHIFWLPVSFKAFYIDMRKILPVLGQSTCKRSCRYLHLIGNWQALWDLKGPHVFEILFH